MAIDQLIFHGQYHQAADRVGIKDAKRVRHFLEAGGVRDSILAHLCMGDFNNASHMADDMIDRFPHKVSWDYIYAGLSRWFQKRRQAAVEIWNSGLTCAYTFYQGLDCALLLWYAGVRFSALQSRAPIDRINQPYFKQRRAGDFIDSIVQYIHQEIDEAEVRRRATQEPWEHMVRANLAQLEFYVACNRFIRGRRHAFKKHMTACATAEGLFDIVFPELLLARFEVRMFPFQVPKGTYTTAGHPTKRFQKKRTKGT